MCAISVAEIAHGIYRANTEDLRHRQRAFLDELKATVPIHPITAATAELVAKIGSENAYAPTTPASGLLALAYNFFGMRPAR
jgi:predicted nucleic acid-binding protein